MSEIVTLADETGGDVCSALEMCRAAMAEAMAYALIAAAEALPDAAD